MMAEHIPRRTSFCGARIAAPWLSGDTSEQATPIDSSVEVSGQTLR